jgi:hypothetical protein
MSCQFALAPGTDPIGHVGPLNLQDPKEYLPFLRELRALDTHEQRFRIDDHLERRASALRNLIAAGAEKWEDASSYMARYELFDVGFELCRSDKAKLAVGCLAIPSFTGCIYRVKLNVRSCTSCMASICTTEKTLWTLLLVSCLICSEAAPAKHIHS